MYYGADLLMQKNVVLVTINYRLGPFGFANFEEDGYTGNMGFKDQQLALKWVSENIDEFGGDPDSITLAGAAAGKLVPSLGYISFDLVSFLTRKKNYFDSLNLSGGTSVHLHALSSTSSKLFENGIALSGTAFNFFSYYEPNNHTDLLRKTFKKEMGNSTDILSFLKTAPASLIVQKTPVGEYNGLVKLNWGVVVESMYLYFFFINHLK